MALEQGKLKLKTQFYTF